MRVDTDGIQIGEFPFFRFHSFVFLNTVCTEDSGDIVTLTLPPSQLSRTVIVTRGLQTPNHVRVTENRPTGPVLLCLSRPPTLLDKTSRDPPSSSAVTPSTQDPQEDTTAEVIGSNPAALDDPVVPPGSDIDVASLSVGIDTLDVDSAVGAQGAPTTASQPSPPSHLRECPPHDRFHVSRDVQMQYPPFSTGWKSGRSWVVVIRGREIGIFHDFWYVLLVTESKNDDLAFD